MEILYPLGSTSPLSIRMLTYWQWSRPWQILPNWSLTLKQKEMQLNPQLLHLVEGKEKNSNFYLEQHFEGYEYPQKIYDQVSLSQKLVAKLPYKPLISTYSYLIITLWRFISQLLSYSYH